eukprot:7876826-Alexandrium_andersonii.AAC.1
MLANRQEARGDLCRFIEANLGIESLGGQESAQGLLQKAAHRVPPDLGLAQPGPMKQEGKETRCRGCVLSVGCQD